MAEGRLVNVLFDAEADGLERPELENMSADSGSERDRVREGLSVSHLGEEL